MRAAVGKLTSERGSRVRALFQHCTPEAGKPYRMSEPHRKLMAIFTRSPGEHISYEALASRIGAQRKSIPVFICHLRRNGMIQRTAPFCFEPSVRVTEAA